MFLSDAGVTNRGTTLRYIVRMSFVSYKHICGILRPAIVPFDLWFVGFWGEVERKMMLRLRIVSAVLQHASGVVGKPCVFAATAHPCIVCPLHTNAHIPPFIWQV